MQILHLMFNKQAVVQVFIRFKTMSVQPENWKNMYYKYRYIELMQKLNFQNFNNFLKFW